MLETTLDTLKSLSARGVWIEISSLSQSISSGLVVLRKGSVD